MQSDITVKRLYSIKEICSIYSLSRKLIDKAIHTGQLRAIQIDNKQKKIKIEDVDVWLGRLVYLPSKGFDLKNAAKCIAKKEGA